MIDSGPATVACMISIAASTSRRCCSRARGFDEMREASPRRRSSSPWTTPLSADITAAVPCWATRGLRSSRSNARIELQRSRLMLCAVVWEMSRRRRASACSSSSCSCAPSTRESSWRLTVSPSMRISPGAQISISWPPSSTSRVSSDRAWPLNSESPETLSGMPKTIWPAGGAMFSCRCRLDRS
ncbi:hypothetical protein D3C76_1283310 [compost metagenome]